MSSSGNIDEIIFIRSSYGLSNYHIFSKKDFTVFIEGGCKDKLTIEECFFTDYTNNRGKNDKLFWNSFFIEFCKKKDFEIRAVGGKKFLKKIFDTLNLQKKFPNSIIICIDRDNKFKDDFPKHKSIFSTYGYSWENEIWNKENAVDVIIPLLSLSRSDGEKQKKDIIQWYDELLLALDRFIFLDIHFFCNGDGLFFRGDDLLNNVIINDAANSVLINKKQLRERWREKRQLRSSKLHRVKSSEIEKYWDCYGHLVDLFFKHKTRFLLKHYSHQNLSSKGIISLLINNFWRTIRHSENNFVFKHYVDQWRQFCAESCKNCSE